MSCIWIAAAWRLDIFGLHQYSDVDACGAKRTSRLFLSFPMRCQPPLLCREILVIHSSSSRFPTEGWVQLRPYPTLPCLTAHEPTSLPKPFCPPILSFTSFPTHDILSATISPYRVFRSQGIPIAICDIDTGRLAQMCAGDRVNLQLHKSRRMVSDQ